MAKSKTDILVDTFRAARKEKYGLAPLVNRNSAHWAFKELLKDMSMDEAKELVTYYGRFYTEDFKWFQYNYDSVYEKLQTEKKQRESDQILMKESEERAKRWREAVARTKSNQRGSEDG